MPEPRTTVTLRLPPEVYQAAQAEAQRFGLSFTAYVVDALMRRADEDQDFDVRKASGKGLHQ